MGDYQDEIGATGARGEKPMGGMTEGQRIAAEIVARHTDITKFPVVSDQVIRTYRTHLEQDIATAIDEALASAREEGGEQIVDFVKHVAQEGDLDFVLFRLRDLKKVLDELPTSRHSVLRQQLAAKDAALKNIAGDNLCWITDPEQAKALPEAEFLESCRRYRQQIANERGEFTGGRTIAQLEEALAAKDAEIERMRLERHAATQISNDKLESAWAEAAAMREALLASDAWMQASGVKNYMSIRARNFDVLHNSNAGEALLARLRAAEERAGHWKADLDRIAQAVYPHKQDRFTYSTDFMIEEIARLRAAESYLNNLLAVIHRDGGQYVAQHGMDKAVEEAMSLSANRIGAEERVAALEAAMNPADILAATAARTTEPSVESRVHLLWCNIAHVHTPACCAAECWCRTNDPALHELSDVWKEPRA